MSIMMSNMIPRIQNVSDDVFDRILGVLITTAAPIPEAAAFICFSAFLLVIMF